MLNIATSIDWLHNFPINIIILWHSKFHIRTQERVQIRICIYNINNNNKVNAQSKQTRPTCNAERGRGSEKERMHPITTTGTQKKKKTSTQENPFNWNLIIKWLHWNQHAIRPTDYSMYALVCNPSPSACVCMCMQYFHFHLGTKKKRIPNIELICL